MVKYSSSKKDVNIKFLLPASVLFLRVLKSVIFIACLK